MNNDINNLSLEEIVQSGVKLTPMMEQYFSIKQQQQADTLLLYRMGDFYEAFFEDAKKTSKLLNIALTHRGKLGDIPIPMAGIPHHAANAYIDKLTSQGVKVAICEQIEDPKEAKGIVRRAVTQIVSPGIPYDLDKANNKQFHFVASAYHTQHNFFLILLDYTTGEFKGYRLSSADELIEALYKYTPKEFISYYQQWEKFPRVEQSLKHLGILQTTLAPDYFKQSFTQPFLRRFIPHASTDKVLNSISDIFNPIGALCYYIISTQGDMEFSHIRPFQLINESEYMHISIKTLQGLEIFPTGRGNYKDSILGFFDRTQSSFGSRKLKDFFLKPTTILETIKQRQTIINFFLQHNDIHKQTRNYLNDVRDIERILTKISTKKANGGDLINLARAYNALAEITQLDQTLKFFDQLNTTEHQQLASLAQEILATINDEIGASIEKGNLIKQGANRKRDRLAALALNSNNAIKELEQKYRQTTEINNLKIKSNNITGFFIEVSKSHLNKVPSNFVRRQTLVNSERFITEELSDLEKEIYSAQLKLEALEKEIFQELCNKIKNQHKTFIRLAETLATFDIMQSFAQVAWQEEFSCPLFTEKSGELQYKNGWHPTIKAELKENFVPHSLNLNRKQYFALITGPNMAGKTTVMRSAAIIQFLAQLGSYVPAQEATLSLCDYIFSRLGASDNILKGESTFMVEMNETAEIIRHATERSLIILDEIGRGTSTYDGISLAWALVEYFVKKSKAITLFATHYHELIELIEELPQAKNLTVATQVKEQNGEIEVQFLYNLIEQAANQSYGIYVAKLAGLPRPILKRANIILKKLERMHKKEQLPSHQEQLTIFNETTTEKTHPVINRLKEIDLNQITPLEALQFLDKLKKEL